MGEGKGGMREWGKLQDNRRGVSEVNQSMPRQLQAIIKAKGGHTKY